MALTNDTGRLTFIPLIPGGVGGTETDYKANIDRFLASLQSTSHFTLQSVSY